jgi:hypothetical protein
VKGRSRVGGPRIEGDRSAQGPGWRESAIQRSRHRPKRCSDRGTGAVTATGSHEGLPDDGRHPGSSTGRLGHARRPRVVLAFQRTLRPVFRGQKPKARTASSPREGMGGVRVNEGARQGCQRLDRKSAPWEETPTLMTEAARCSSWGNASPAIRRSGLGRRETSGPPVLPCGAQDSVGRPRRESGESEPGTHAVWVHVSRMGGRNRSDASRVFSTGRSQGLVVTEGASQEEVRSRD